MKRILKIIFLSFISVVGAIGLAVGGMYLFGGFEQKDVYADNIVFNTSSVVSADSFALKIITTTAGVNKTTLRLSTLPGGEDVIDFPSQVEIGKIFTVKPKQVQGVNFGGKATLVATYNEDNANSSVVAKCDVLIDVPVESINVKLKPFTTTPNQDILICPKNTRLENVLGINPTKALMPYVEFYSTQQNTNVTDKAIYLELLDDLGLPLDAKVAQFVVNNVAQQSTVVKVNYTYKVVNSNNEKAIVFDDNIVVRCKNIQSDVSLNAYVYSTYKEQETNTIEGVVQLNKQTTKNNTLGFTIGNYEIVDMNIAVSSKEVMLKQDSKIYLDNPNAGPNNINLGFSLTTGSEGIEAGYYYPLDTYISIDGNDFVSVKNANNSTEVVENLGVPVNFEGISREKTNWYWTLNIYNYLAYDNYLSTREPIDVKIRYFDKEKQRTFERSFDIIPIIQQIDTFTVKYSSGQTSFEKESAEEEFTLGRTLNNNEYFDIKLLNNEQVPDNFGIDYFISLSENSKNGKTTVSTVPKKPGVYKVTFSFVLDYEAETQISALTINSVFSIDGSSSDNLKQNGKSINDVSTIQKNVPIEAEYVVDMKNIPTTDVLFTVEAESSGTFLQKIEIENFKTKFFEQYSDGSFSSLPYLSVDNVKYDVDFDYYYDQATFTNYLKINKNNNENTYNLNGIGQFYITAQVVYNEIITSGNETISKSFWLGKSAVASVRSYQNLNEVTATKYSLVIEDGKVTGEILDGLFSTAQVKENNFDGWIYITSTQLDALTNYINAGQVEIYAEQIIEGDFEGYKSKIEQQKLNKNTIVLGDEFIPVTDATTGKVLGYKISYSVGEVYTIKTGNDEKSILPNNFKVEIKVRTGTDEENKPKEVKALFAMEGNTSVDYLSISVQDKFIDEATLTYNNVNTFTKEAPLQLYANVQSDEVVYLNKGGVNIDYSQFKYGFKWNDDSNTVTTQTLTTEFSVQDNSGISLDGLYTFSASESGVGGLKFNNFPRANADEGVLVRMKIFSGSMENFNIHYMWDEFSQSFKQTQNDNLTAEIYFKIYGLKITIIANDQNQFVGNKGSTVDILSGSSTAGNELFNVKIEYVNSENKAATLSINNLQKILTTYIDKDYLFVKNENALSWEGGKTLKYAKDFVNNEDVIFRFFVGSNSAANALKINVPIENATQPNQYMQVASYTQTFTSPYVVDFVTEFEMPNQNVQFANASYVGMCYDESGNALTDSDANPGEGKVGSLTQARIDKIKNISITVENITALDSYQVSNPIIVNSDNTLTFKVVPVSSYKATLLFKLTTNTDEIISRWVEITVTNKFNNSNISIGTKVDAVEGVNEEYYYIDAGITNVYSVGDGIAISGALAENIGNIDEDGLKVTFADVDNNSTEEINNIDVDTHMKSTSWKATNKSFSIYSDDLKDEKSVLITLTFTFKDGGKYVYQKTIIVKPNIQVSITINTLKEGDDINLLNCFKKGDEILDLYTSYDPTIVDNTKVYCKNSFSLDTQNVFVESQYEDTYAVSVKYGAYNACGGTTTIGFYYIVNNNLNVYTLYFEFEVEIVA